MMNNFSRKLIPLILFLISSGAQAYTFAPNTSYDVCFTPNKKGQVTCTDRIVNTINNSKKSILVQAYNFTSAPIIRALIAAHNRGVDVKIILDKSDFRGRSAKITAIVVKEGIPIWKDYKPRIAHNKVMVIDGDTVITGSFNFTHSAQFNNTENVVIIHDAGISKLYTSNWWDREVLSQKLKRIINS